MHDREMPDEHAMLSTRNEVITWWYQVCGTIMHQHRQPRQVIRGVERHADHCMINNRGRAVVQTRLPYLELPLRVAGHPHDPVVLGRYQLEETSASVDDQLFE